MVQEYTVGPAGFRVLYPRKPGAFLETGSLYPLLAALHPFPLLGFPAHTLYPQGACGIRKAAEPLTAALPYRCGEFTTLLTVCAVIFQGETGLTFLPPVWRCLIKNRDVSALTDCPAFFRAVVIKADSRRRRLTHRQTRSTCNAAGRQGLQAAKILDPY